MDKFVEIFGKKYPIAYGEYNSVALKDWLPDFFKETKSFTADEYYNEMVRLYPRFKKKWFDFRKKATEADIQQMFIKKRGDGVLDGSTSVPKVEKKLKITIGGGYKYPDNMSDIDYHAYMFKKLGFFNPFHEKTKIESVQDAYMGAWQSLHYPEYKEMIQILYNEYKRLEEINPELKQLKFDKNDPAQLTCVYAGCIYDFPLEDIQYFLDGHRAQDERDRMEKELANIGLHKRDFYWVVSPQTIENIGKKIKRQNEPQIENTVIVTERIPKTSKEIVSKKLKGWGLKEEDFMLITQSDGLRTSYDGIDDNGNRIYSRELFWNKYEQDLKAANCDVIMGFNNGVCGAYFAEGVYVVGGSKLNNILWRRAKNVGLGVILSNGDVFTDEFGNEKQFDTGWAKLVINASNGSKSKEYVSSRENRNRDR